MRNLLPSPSRTAGSRVAGPRTTRSGSPLTDLTAAGGLIIAGAPDTGVTAGLPANTEGLGLSGFAATRAIRTAGMPVSGRASVVPSRIARFAAVALLGLLFLSGLAAQAHEIGTTRVAVSFPEPGAYLVEIVTDPEALKVKWQGGEADFLARVDLRFDGARATPSFRQEGGAIRLTGVLPAGAQTFTWKYGWTFASYSLTVGPNSVWLDGGETSAPIAVAAPAPGRWRVAGRYMVLGFTHILPLGWDHMLFILGLFLASSSVRSLLAQATVFTVAHSISLGLAMFNVFRLPAEIVEPAIWLSIVYIFFERRAAARRRMALVFGFGLLHGMGFASVLTELGLPRAEFVTALAGFNLGVEAAQLAVIGICYFGATQSANVPFLNWVLNWRWAALRRAS